MDRLYIIEGTNDFFIQKEINKILKGIENEYDVIKYTLENNTIDDVIEALDTYDMFLKQKVVILSNPFFLNEKPDDTFNQTKFLKYVCNPSSNILILTTNKINNRLKFVSELIKSFKYIKVKDINLDMFVKENLNGYEMDSALIRYFLTKVGSNLNMIVEELNKLKSYKLDTKRIEKVDIDLITNENVEATIFEFIDAIIKKDKKRSCTLYEHFINKGTEIFSLIVMVSNQIRLIYNVKILSKLNDNIIASKLGVHEYPVKLARSKGYGYSKKELLGLLKDLAKMDEDIKTGKQLPNISFLAFIMNM